MNSLMKMGFTWTIKTLTPGGRVLGIETVHNLIPDEGVAHVMGVTFKAAAQNPTWYIALYEGNYTPTNTLTAATFATIATECTAYAETTRVEWVEGAITGGILDNSANMANFTFSAPKTVYGGVLISSPTKGATNGVIASAVRFASPKILDTGSILQVVAGNGLVSA